MQTFTNVASRPEAGTAGDATEVAFRLIAVLRPAHLNLSSRPKADLERWR